MLGPFVMALGLFPEEDRHRARLLWRFERRNSDRIECLVAGLPGNRWRRDGRTSLPIFAAYMQSSKEAGMLSPEPIAPRSTRPHARYNGAGQSRWPARSALSSSGGGSMRPEVIAAIVDGGIPFLGGIYATLMGFRVIGKRPGESVKYDQWYERFGTTFKVLGPLLIAFGLIQMARGIVGAS